MLPGARLLQIRHRSISLGLGRRPGAGVKQCRRDRLDDGHHRLAGAHISAGFERDALQLAGDRGGDDIALLNASLALFVDGGAERAHGHARRLHRDGPWP